MRRPKTRWIAATAAQVLFVDLSSDNDLARRTITKERELQIIQAALA
jgi:hypothetical protein